MTKSQTVAERTALEIAAEFARVYAEGDDEWVRELVTADVIEREITRRDTSSSAGRTS